MVEIFTKLATPNLNAEYGALPLPDSDSYSDSYTDSYEVNKGSTGTDSNDSYSVSYGQLL